MEDNHQWKTTSNERQPLIKSNLKIIKLKLRWSNKIINASNEDELKKKTTSSGRGPPMEDIFQWKMTSSGRQKCYDWNTSVLTHNCWKKK